jgi:lysozyme
MKIDFVIQKCTEGTTYKDPTYEKNKAGARSVGMLFSSYHFARGTDAIKEARYFVEKVRDIQQGELLALDWEISHPATVNWCLQWLKEVERLVGFKPLIYLNSSTANRLDWSPVIKNNTGLWIANYGVNDGKRHENPPIGKWSFFAIHQYTSRGKIDGIVGNVDLNYCKMSSSTLKKYGKK